MGILNELLQGNFSGAGVAYGQILPLPSMCRGWFYAGTAGLVSGSTTQFKDYSNYNLPATIFGAPTLSQYYFSVGAPTAGQYALTQVLDPGTDFTAIVVARTSDTGATNANQPKFLCNFGADSQTITSNKGIGIGVNSVVTGGAATIEGFDCFNNSGAATATIANITSVPISAWRLLAVNVVTVAGVTTRTLMDITGNATQTAANTTARVYNEALPYRFGGAYGNGLTPGGTADVAFAALYGQGVTTALITSTIVPVIRSNMTARSITV